MLYGIKIDAEATEGMKLGTYSSSLPYQICWHKIRSYNCYFRDGTMPRNGENQDRLFRIQEDPLPHFGIKRAVEFIHSNWKSQRAVKRNALSLHHPDRLQDRIWGPAKFWNPLQTTHRPNSLPIPHKSYQAKSNFVRKKSNLIRKKSNFVRAVWRF